MIPMNRPIRSLNSIIPRATPTPMMHARSSAPSVPMCRGTFHRTDFRHNSVQYVTTNANVTPPANVIDSGRSQAGRS
jgi:hypothetical protein